MDGLSDCYPNFERLFGKPTFDAITAAAFKEKISPMALFFVFTEQNAIAYYSDQSFLSFCRGCRQNPERYLPQIGNLARKISEAEKRLGISSSTSPVLFAIACSDPERALSSVKFGIEGWEKRYAIIAGREASSLIKNKLEPLSRTLADIRYGLAIPNEKLDRIEYAKPQEREDTFIIRKN